MKLLRLLSLIALAMFSSVLCIGQAKPTQEQLDKWQKEAEERSHNDWAFLKRYAAANAKLEAPATGEKRVVFMGDSITDAWIGKCPEFFAKHPYVDRGISGQTTPQMLVRFRHDVIELKPSVVVLLAGINDIAGNTGPSTQEMIAANYTSMVELAKANNIKVVIASVLPAYDFPWRPGTLPADKVVQLNAWLKTYAEHSGCVYLDYFSAMVDGRKGLRAEYTYDGVHPNKEGYLVMAPLADAAIAKALEKSP